MAKAKKSTEPQPQPSAVNGPGTGDVLTLTEAAAYLRVSENDVITAATTQGLPGRLVSGEWRFLKSSIQQWLSTSQPTGLEKKAAQLALAGKYRDDPDLEEIVEEAMQRRGRQPAEAR